MACEGHAMMDRGRRGGCMVYMLKSGSVLKVRGNSGMILVLLNCLDFFRRWRNLIVVIIIISFACEIFPAFMLVGRTELGDQN
jgi:hypothetical protein